MSLIAQATYSIKRVAKERYRFDVSPETLQLPSDKDGNYTVFTDAKITLKLSYDGREIYPNYNTELNEVLDIGPPVGMDAAINSSLIKSRCNGSVSNGVLSITSLTADAGSMDITIEYGDFKQIKRITLAKSKQGSAYNTATVSLYIRSKIKPTAISLYRYKYVFSNGGLLSLGGAVGEYEGWHRDIIEGEDPLWITSATIMSREETYTIETYEWTAPVIHTEHGGGVDPKNLFSLVKTNDYWGEFCDIIKDQYGTGLFLDTDGVGGNNIPAHVVYEEDQQYSLSLKARLDGNIDYGPSRYIWYMIHLKYEGLTNAITHLVYVHDTQAGFDLEYVMLEHYDSSSDLTQANGAWVDTLPVKRANRYIHVRLKCGFSNGTVSYKGYNKAFNGNRKIERVKLFYRSYAYDATSNPTAQIQYWNRVNKMYPVGNTNASSDADLEEIYLYFKYTDNVTVDQFLPFIDGPLIYLSGVSRRDKTLKSIELSIGYTYTYIYDPMLVKGPKILEFTPAPEDIFNEIETVVDKATKIPYMAGEWDPTISYHRTDNSYPVVTLTGESNVQYYFLIAVVSLGENPSDNEKIWEYAPDFKMIITEALFSKNAKLGEFIFNGGKMFSQWGDLNGEADNHNYLVAGHKPNFEVDGETGRVRMKHAEVEGTVYATSGEIGSLKIKDGKLLIGNVGDNRIELDPSSRRMIFTTYDDFNSGSIGFDAEGALLNLYKRFSASLLYSSSVELNGYRFLLRRLGQYGETTGSVTIDPTGVMVSNASNTTEVLYDGVYVNGAKLGDGGGSGYTHPSTHPASMISEGTFPEIVKANNNISYTTKQVRNMILSTNNAISSQMANGDIWIKYE